MLVDELKRKINTADDTTVLFKYTDAYTYQSLKDAVFEVFGPDVPEQYDERTQIEDLMNALESPSMFGDKKCVILSGLKKAPDTAYAKKLTAEVAQKIDDLLFIVCDNNASFDFLKKSAEVWDYSKPDDATISQELRGICNKAGVDLSSVDAAYLLSKVGEMDKAVSEMQKTIAYVGKASVITRADIDECVFESMERKLYVICGDLAEGRTKKALEGIQYLLVRNTSPYRILAELTSQYRRMFYCSVSKLTDSELAKLFGMKSVYPLTVARRISRNYTQVRLKKQLDHLYCTEHSFKTGYFSEQKALLANIAFIISCTSARS